MVLKYSTAHGGGRAPDAVDGHEDQHQVVDGGALSSLHRWIHCKYMEIIPKIFLLSAAAAVVVVAAAATAAAVASAAAAAAAVQTSAGL